MIVNLSWMDILLAALPFLVLIAILGYMRLGVSRQLLIGVVRTLVQLSLVGAVLTAVFKSDNPLWTMGFSMVMICAGTYEVTRRQIRKFLGGWSIALSLLGLLTAAVLSTGYALMVVVDVSPWWKAQYAVPLLGMILGNTMNGISLGLNTLTTGVWQQRAVIESRLALGEPAQDAVKDIKRDCLRNALTPIMNALAVCGVVSLPGMMTGQILAGNDPQVAARYQMMIMYLIGTGCAAGCLVTVTMASKRLFDKRDRLRLDRLQLK
ncbi:MAG: iron export ABC transporter permease subunit FetB [Kiritimatiellae bacterium]|jgi:putative ABC transport system permease protein|nr:iron export ABC transporter permease subunit FetB [Kiritimatiellia bacterium]